jgi:hypothetical protein
LCQSIYNSEYNFLPQGIKMEQFLARSFHLKKYLKLKVKTINIERELTELQNKKQASNREEIENRINLLENELKTFYEEKTIYVFLFLY